MFAAAHLDVPVLADDSGLHIDALDGEPGVRSARYIDPGKTPADQRAARFVCHLTLAYGADVIHETTGVCEGTIGFAPRGGEGFGYDPIFVVPDMGVTFAEITREQKAARSHRGQAVRAMAEFLRTWKSA